MTLDTDVVVVIIGSTVGTISAVLTLFITKFYDSRSSIARMAHERHQLLTTQIINKRLEKGEAIFSNVCFFAESYFYLHSWKNDCEKIKENLNKGAPMTGEEKATLIELYCENSDEPYSDIQARIEREPLDIIDELLDMANEKDNEYYGELVKIRNQSRGWTLYFIKEDPALLSDVNTVYSRIANLPVMEFDDGTKVKMRDATTAQMSAFEKEIDARTIRISERLRNVIEAV